MAEETSDEFGDVAEVVKQENRDGFYDPKNQFPRKDYINVQSTNFAERGIKRNELNLEGGHVALNLDIKPLLPTEYPLAQVRETISGHVIETDDTAGAERVLIKHRTGAGIDMRPDGSVIINARNNTIRVTAGDEKVIVEGNGEIVYNGNMKLTVSGNLDINVGGDFNVTTGGDHKQNIKGSYKQEVIGNHTQTINHDKTTNVGDNRSDFTCGFHFALVKKNWDQLVQGDGNIIVGHKDNEDGTGKKNGILKMSGVRDIIIASEEINMNSEKMNVVADSGTIGGENIIMYNYNMYTGHSVNIGDTLSVPTIYNDTQVTSGHMNIPVVYGDLQGTATQAEVSNEAGYHPSSGLHAGAGYGYSATTDTTADIPVDPKATFKMDNTNIRDVLDRQYTGTGSVTLDSSYRESFVRDVDYGGIAERRLTPAEVRAKLRDPLTAGNTDFVLKQQLEGKLSDTFYTKTPSGGYGRTASKSTSPKRGSTGLPNAKGASTKRFT